MRSVHVSVCRSVSIIIQIADCSFSLTKHVQDPNEDTEWNDILRAKGILPPKPKEAEITEESIVNMIEQTIQDRQDPGNTFPHWMR